MYIVMSLRIDVNGIICLELEASDTFDTSDTFDIFLSIPT